MGCYQLLYFCQLCPPNDALPDARLSDASPDPNIEVFGPQETQTKGANKIIHDQEHIIIDSFSFLVIGTPGHTLGHVAYYSEPYLFCGDTLFSGGCGRLFEVFVVGFVNISI